MLGDLSKTRLKGGETGSKNIFSTENLSKIKKKKKSPAQEKCFLRVPALGRKRLI